MHVAIAVLTIVATWKWADWRHWRTYHPTMLYMFTMAMLYEYLTDDFTMWRFHPDFLMNHSLTVLLYATVTMPLTVLLFLSTFPTKRTAIAIHYVKWICIYIGVESCLLLFKRISYEHTWSLWWSLEFDVMMFPILWLHHKKPLLAYALSALIIIAYMMQFQVPFK